MKTKGFLVGIVISVYIGILGTVAYGANVETVTEHKVMVPLFDTSTLKHNDVKSVKYKIRDSRVPNDPKKRCPQWESKFEEYGLPVDVFSYIAWRESGCNEKAINAKFDANGDVTWTLNKDGSIDRGLVQINSSWKTVTKKVCGTELSGLLNVDCNLSVAKYIMDNSKGKLLNWRIQN
jgi:hypothetical protein